MVSYAQDRGNFPFFLKSNTCESVEDTVKEGQRSHCPSLIINQDASRKLYTIYNANRLCCVHVSDLGDQGEGHCRRSKVTVNMIHIYQKRGGTGIYVNPT